MMLCLAKKLMTNKTMLKNVNKGKESGLLENRDHQPI